MTKQERQNRVVARGEHSDHAHVITGDVNVKEDGILEVGEKGGAIKHLVESVWVEKGVEKWTGEHLDIDLEPGSKYKTVRQREFHPEFGHQKRVD